MAHLVIDDFPIEHGITVLPLNIAIEHGGFP